MSRTASRAVRGIARTLTVLILGVWGLFMIAHIFGDAGSPSRPLVAGDYAILSLLVASLFGLGIALKWERAGAILTLAAIAACAALNWRVLMFPSTLIPITAMLFLAASLSSQRKAAAAQIIGS